MSNSIRLTVGQALVRFVAKQYVERDGRQNRFIEGIWGIFGHGNVSGLGQGIVEFAEKEGLKFYRPQHEQGMVQYFGGLRQTSQSTLNLCLHDLDRTWCA